MKWLAGLIVSLGMVLALAPFIIRLAKRLHRGLTGIAGGSVVDPGGGGYVAQLRREYDHESGGAVNGEAGSDGDDGGGGGGDGE